MPAPGFTFAAYGFGLLAGILSILSPCVLPLLPIVLGSALGAHRFGAVALSLGLALSFVIVGLFVATIGFSLGLDGDLFRRFGAMLLLVFGCLMLFPGLQARVIVLLGRLPGNRLGTRLQDGVQAYRPSGIGGQLMLGLLLGFWATPAMTAGHLLFAIMMTAYIIVGVQFEERDLVAEFGPTYQQYRQRVPMLLPRWFGRRPADDQGREARRAMR